MIRININGGLGNQMFQYALYMALMQTGKKVQLDTSHINRDMTNMKRCTIFEAFILDKEYPSLNSASNRIVCHLYNPLFVLLNGQYHEVLVGKYDEKVSTIDRGYLDGFWQTEKYFSKYRDSVFAAFQLKQSLPEKSNRILLDIQKESTPVSLHIRLGDYNTPANRKIYGKICTEEYYNRAITYILSQYPNARFFLFSNDIEKAQSILPQIDYEIVDVNNESTGWADMYLMSQCKHNIIANSSFSWWGAWLNQNPDKIVVAPSKWLNTREMPDICPESWIRL